jgi:opacity protein-like surface antigen
MGAADRRRVSMTAWGKRFLGLALLLAAIPAWAAAPQERRFEITPFAGYRFGGDLGDVENASHAQVAEGSSYGVMLDWEVEKDAFVELLYSRQQSEVTAGGTILGSGETHITDITVEQYLLGGTYQWENDTHFRPFVSGGFGVVRHLPEGSSSETRLAFGLGVGVKAALAKHLALRFDGRWVIDHLSGSTEISCISPGQCLIVADGTFFSQVEVSGGITFGF